MSSAQSDTYIQCSHYQIPESVFVDIKRLILKGKLEKHPRKNLNSEKKKRTSQGSTLSNLRHATKLRMSSQCGAGQRLDTQFTGQN